MSGLKKALPLCIMTLISIAVAILSTSETPVAAGPCTKDCICSGPNDALRIDCSNMNFTSIPPDIIPIVAILDMSWNKIKELPSNAFAGLRWLQELNLANNLLSLIPEATFLKLSSLRTLYMQNNHLQTIRGPSLKPLVNLENLHLSSNRLDKLEAGSFMAVSRLQKLSLDGNQLTDVPVAALIPLIRLQALNMASNEIQEIPDFAFQTLENLIILVLHTNTIDTVGLKAFDGLKSLKVLELNNNKLLVLPEAIASLPMLREFTFSENQIPFLEGKSFQHNPQLTLLQMAGNPIMSADRTTFSNLTHLKKLVLSEARMLSEFPDLSGTSSLEHLRLDRAILKSVPSDTCEVIPRVRSLNLKSNQLTEVPVLHRCTDLRLIDLSYNFITTLDYEPFAHQRALIDLFLGHNQITIISENSFKGLHSLQVLDLESNDIQDLHPDAFKHFKDLRDLNLGGNRYPHLPTAGLQNLRELKTFNNRELKEFPAIDNFPRVNTLALSYAYHCCAFSDTKSLPSKPNSPLQETIVWLSKDDVDMASWNANITDVWPGYENFSTKFEEFANQLWKTFGREYPLPDNLAQYAEEYFESNYVSEDHGTNQRFSVQCLPEPGPFMPCTDLFGWWSLRCGVWVVFLLALLGNGIVVIVLLVGRSKMDVPRFLVCNLAGADFFMGIYLGMLAVVDASTLGEFKVSAIKWQTSVGCQVAGFLGVLSSELSVFTLSVITLERNYAITHAMHLNKRLSLRHAGYIMFGGWTFAGVMATLPLVGISDYRKFAICLPFETEDAISLSYVVFLILINGVAFLILMGCYLKMYCAIRGSQAWNSNDSRIARRMALLVFTDFICWAPIAFFSLTAVCGIHLISLEEAKVFAIFVLPLNSCANPFLYAIFTKQFKKDCIHICKRIEESRVTRGIGRGRHSSNFSNRHTPVTTNSGGPAPAPVGSNSDPLQPPQERVLNPDYAVCSCGVAWKQEYEPRNNWKMWALRYLLCQSKETKESNGDNYTYAIAQIQRSIERRHKHASSISSENFSSRSDSWRQGNIPLRLMDQMARRGSRTYQRKASQDSNLSCSRQDSSTSTFRMSRSSFSTEGSSQQKPACSRPPVASNERECRISVGRDGKPKLCRQTAVEEIQGRKSDFNPDSSKHSASERRKAKMCAFCARKATSSPPLVFKSKDFEQKFTCFYNRLAESSHEENSDGLFSSKEDQLILLSDSQSASEDCQRNMENEVGDQVPDGTLLCLQNELIPDVNNYCKDINSSISPNDLQMVQCIDGAGDHTHELSVFYDHTAAKCRSLTNIGGQENLEKENKCSSDNSLVRFVVDNPNSISKLFSSQDKGINSRRLRDAGSFDQTLQGMKSSKSENVVHDYPKEYTRQFNATPAVGKHFTPIPEAHSCKQLPTAVASISDKKVKNSLSTPNITTINSNECSPLIDDEGI